MTRLDFKHSIAWLKVILAFIELRKSIFTVTSLPNNDYQELN